MPIGNDMQLGISTGNSALYRNNSGASYPYIIGGILYINETSASSTGYYYFYYDIEVESICLGVTSIEENNYSKKIIKRLDILGRTSKKFNNKIIFYIYDDGTVEKSLTID